MTDIASAGPGMSLPFYSGIPGALFTDLDAECRSKNWYAVLVRSRHEFVAARELTRKGVSNYLPAVQRLRQWKDRKKLLEFPLFPGYVFVNLYDGPRTFLPVMETRGVVRFISLVPGRPTPLEPEDIDSLKRMVASGEELDVYPSIREGMAVRVKRGPLRGLTGILVKRANRDLFLINFELLGRSVGLKIYADDVEQA